MNKLWVMAIIGICAGCTFLERAFPFLLFRGKAVPEPISTLGKLLPMAIITTLAFYCLRNLTFSEPAAWAPQLIASAVTVLLHLWKGSTMLSIAGGTVCCMLLTQVV